MPHPALPPDRASCASPGASRSSQTDPLPGRAMRRTTGVLPWGEPPYLGNGVGIRVPSHENGERGHGVIRTLIVVVSKTLVQGCPPTKAARNFASFARCPHPRPGLYFP
jgi:hypothetical protein